MAEKASFETQLQTLQTIVDQLEQGDVPLEEALKQFKTGVELSQQLQKTLNNAENTLTKLMDDDGNETLFDQSKGEDSKTNDDD